MGFSIKSLVRRLFRRFFKKRRELKLGVYGPTNAGKTTLANRICMDFVGEEMGKVSPIPHETREVTIKEHVVMKKGKNELVINLVDAPGIATKIDFEDFVKRGISVKKAKKRAKEATQGVIEAIKWLDKMDVVLVVTDSRKNPYTQVNITILGNLEARNTPVIIVANKTDLKGSKPGRVEKLFPQYHVVAVSAKKGKNIDKLYEKIFELVG